jgi:hypothetical protein
MQPVGGFDIDVHHAFINGILLQIWRELQKLPTNNQSIQDPSTGCFVPSPVVFPSRVEFSGMKAGFSRSKGKHIESA